MNLNTLQAFRHGMYHCFGNAKDALFNLVDALSSEAGASSFPEWSFSPFFERTWPTEYATRLQQAGREVETPFSVSIQTEASPIPSVPVWFGEVALVAHALAREGILSKISDRPLARRVVGEAPRSIRRHDAPNTMERCACSLLPASLTVAPAPCASPVKNTPPPPKNLVVSALSCLPCLSLRQKSRRLRALLLLPLQPIPSCGGIGHARSLAGPGSVGSAATWSPCKLHSVHHLPPRLLCSRAPSERIGA